MFITFEGGEGSGKSTQVKLLYKYLTFSGNKYNNVNKYNEYTINNTIIQTQYKSNALNNSPIVQKESFDNLNKDNIGNNKEVLGNKTIVDNSNKCNRDVIITREPGGTVIADKLRNILLQGRPEKMNAITEALLFLASRAECWNKVIKPALDNNKIVICDRFHDSTLVYQGICSNIDINLLNNIYKIITNNIFPNRTYLIDIDPVIGLQRSLREENKDTRFEMKSLEYHKRIREAYLQIAKNNNRYLIIDGNLSVQDINNIIINDINNLIQTTN